MYSDTFYFVPRFIVCMTCLYICLFPFLLLAPTANQTTSHETGTNIRVRKLKIEDIAQIRERERAREKC